MAGRSRKDEDGASAARATGRSSKEFLRDGIAAPAPSPAPAAAAAPLHVLAVGCGSHIYENDARTVGGLLRDAFECAKVTFLCGPHVAQRHWDAAMHRVQQLPADADLLVYISGHATEDGLDLPGGGIVPFDQLRMALQDLPVSKVKSLCGRWM